MSAAPSPYPPLGINYDSDDQSMDVDSDNDNKDADGESVDIDDHHVPALPVAGPSSYAPVDSVCLCSPRRRRPR